MTLGESHMSITNDSLTDIALIKTYMNFSIKGAVFSHCL